MQLRLALMHEERRQTWANSATVSKDAWRAGRGAFLNRNEHKMQILVVGAGSTGGYFGGRLAEAGRDVTFLVRPARARALRADGLRIVSPHGDVALSPKIVSAGEIAAPFDVVLLTVKAFGLERALDDVAPAIGPDTMVLPFLNGLRHVDLISDRFGPERLVGCVCKIAATLDGDGRVVQMNPVHAVAYGEMNGGPSPRTEALHGLMSGAGFDARLSSNIAREMWEKWTMLATLGGMTCLLRGDVGEIMATPGGPELMARFLDEVVATATKAGVAPGEAALKATVAMLTDPSSTMTASMYRDLIGGAPVEADQILGDLLRRAGEAGLDTPLLAAAYAQLAIYARRREV